ncbi:hypothetical protein ABT010_13355 [Streptomyces sp. NPDC002668]|uniref:hypothetical protein n=1 Tax=Streptomyces sp. NPDC002668 TaxID=3154422 RepID=UPI003327C2A7
MNTDPLERRVNGTALGDFRPLPLASDDQAQAARAEAEAVLAQANRMHRQAKDEADRTVKAARDEAQRLRDEAHAETERRQKRDDNLDTWAARLVIAGAVGLTASGEYSLARMAGFDRSVAWLLPFVIDVYVIQAFRRHRDIVQAIALTIAANVTYHLADAGLFGVSRNGHGDLTPKWWMIALVASVASLILWRMHLMVAPPKVRRERRSWRYRERPQIPGEQPVSAQIERVDERPQQEPKALTERPDGRAQTPTPERPDERPSKPKSERRERAQSKPKMSADKPLTERRRERARRLYDELGKRPEWTEIRDALVADKLAPKTISRPTCQRIRDAIEKDEPALAALGSDNVRPLTGS